MRRLEDLDLKDLVLPTPSFDEIDRFILGPQAADGLVEAVSGVLLARARADVLLDAYRQLLLEDASVLSPTEALIRSGSIREDPAQANKYARAVLITAVAFGSVTMEETAHGYRFRHVHPGVVHVRSQGNVVDARTAIVVGRGSTLAGLVKRESKRRGRAVEDRRRQLRETISEHLPQVDPSTPVHVGDELSNGRISARLWITCPKCDFSFQDASSFRPAMRSSRISRCSRACE